MDEQRFSWCQYDEEARIGAAETFLRKGRLELLLASSPKDPKLRSAYLEELIYLARSYVGLSWIKLPEFHYPIYFRLGTSDIYNIKQILWDEEYGFLMDESPERILDLGAYIGLAAIYFANRFPEAQVLCVEPSEDNYHLLEMNTAPYRNIAALKGAIWDKETSVGRFGHDGGDWGYIVEEHGEKQGSYACRTYTLPQILERVQWSSVDFIKCDIEGAERKVFADPTQGWINGVRWLAIETHDRMFEGCSAAVNACFPSGRFNCDTRGEFLIYHRRGSATRGTETKVCPKLLLDTAGVPTPIMVSNPAPEMWSFYGYGQGNFQLHPNPPGTLPITALISVVMRGHTLVKGQVAVENHLSEPINFELALVAADNGAEDVVASTCCTVHAGGTAPINLSFPPQVGSRMLRCITSMTSNASTNNHAWARLLDLKIM